MANLNASAFQYSIEVYEIEFEKILVGVTSCYKMMLADHVSVPLNDENSIRDILLLNYLKNRTIKKKCGLTNYRFDREIPEDRTQGRVDIRILTKNDFEKDEAYYVIECKRIENKNLAGLSGLNAEYIKNGIIRFVTAYYSSYYRVNGMLGFVVEPMDIDANIKNINNLLKHNFSNANTITFLTALNFIKNFEYQYYSIHQVINNNSIKLYHLMFDFSAIMN